MKGKELLQDIVAGVFAGNKDKNKIQAPKTEPSL